MAHKPTQIVTITPADLSIYTHQQTQNAPNSSCNSPLTCINIKRLLFALKYYQTLDLANNQNGRQIFYDFMINTYKYQVYDDLTHFMKYHQQQIQEIKQFAINNYHFTSCDLSQCQYADRHSFNHGIKIFLFLIRKFQKDGIIIIKNARNIIILPDNNLIIQKNLMMIVFIN